MTSMMCALSTTNNKRKWTIARACHSLREEKIGNCGAKLKTSFCQKSYHIHRTALMTSFFFFCHFSIHWLKRITKGFCQGIFLVFRVWIELVFFPLLYFWMTFPHFTYSTYCIQLTIDIDIIVTSYSKCLVSYFYKVVCCTMCNLGN